MLISGKPLQIANAEGDISAGVSSWHEDLECPTASAFYRPSTQAHLDAVAVQLGGDERKSRAVRDRG